MTAAVEEIRRAAALMRERAAEPIAPSPWIATGRFVYHDGANPVAEAMGPRNAEHIASWHPAMALAVADWLSWAGSGVHIDDRALAVARAYLGDQP